MFNPLKAVRSMMPYKFCPACIQSEKRPNKRLKKCSALTPGCCPVVKMADCLDRGAGHKGGETLRAVRAEIMVTGLKEFEQQRWREKVTRR